MYPFINLFNLLKIKILIILLLITVSSSFLSLKPPVKPPKIVDKNTKKLNDIDDPGSLPPPKRLSKSKLTP